MIIFNLLQNVFQQIILATFDTMLSINKWKTRRGVHVLYNLKILLHELLVTRPPVTPH